MASTAVRHGTDGIFRIMPPAPRPRSITDSLSPEMVPVVTTFRTYHHPAIRIEMPAAIQPRLRSAATGSAVNRYAFVSNPSPSVADIPTCVVRNPAQITALNRTTASESFPTRATSMANPGISATTAAHPAATRSSPSTSRPIANTSGIVSEAIATPAHRSAITCASSPAPRNTPSSGTISQ